MNFRECFDLAGNVALVTGASRGIGESVVRALAASGARVIVSSRNQEPCEAIASSIRRDGGDAEAMASHMGDTQRIAALIANIEARYGRLDILVNNAATNPHFGSILDTDAAAFEKTVAVNLRGYFFCSSHAAKLMAKNGSGSIVNVASIAGIAPGTATGIYAITKGAVIAMTKAFACECAPLGVRVNAILPGFTDTRFSSALVDDPDRLARIVARVPLGRIAGPDEMSGAVLYL